MEDFQELVDVCGGEFRDSTGMFTQVCTYWSTCVNCVCFAGSRTVPCIDSQRVTVRHGACELVLPSDSRSTQCKQCSSFRVS